MTIKNILIDLDGTLTDPKTGIHGSIRFALQKLGSERRDMIRDLGSRDDGAGAGPRKRKRSPSKRKRADGAGE